jgi:hypothetical protein
MCVSVTHLSLGAVSAQAEEMKPTAPQVVLSETYNAVTGVYFTNIAVHKGSHKPGLVERRFRADVKYWLLDTKYYDQGELGIGNPPLVELVRELGSKNRPEKSPTTLYAMAYEMAQGNPGAVPHYPQDRDSLGSLLQGVGDKRKAEDNHVVNLVLQR